MKTILQHDQMDCGPACLAMVSSNYGKNYSLNYLRNNSFLAKDGVSLAGITEAAGIIGMETVAAKLSLSKLKKEGLLPSIVHWNQNHFVVLKDIKKNFFSRKDIYKVADPAHGFIELNEDNFKKSWLSEDDKGVALFLSPTDEFYTKHVEKKSKLNFKFMLGFLKPYKKEVSQLLLGLLAGSILTLIFPILTQLLIDKGVNNGDMDIVFAILIAQVFLFLGSTVIEIVRNWIMLYIGTRINITIISEFLKKILKLPIRFFDTKLMGDFNQRIRDHERIEYFLTSQSLITLFSLINFSVFFFVLFRYDVKILSSYLILTIVAIIWSSQFFKKRKIYDYNKFQHRSDNQDSIYELVSGIQEIKLNNLEEYKRNKWEKIQVELFKVNTNILKLDQLQLVGFDFINQLKNIFVTFLAAREVIMGNLTLGAMLAISYIIGQMNSPVNQLISFFRSLQDARLSMERLSEVQDQEEEERSNHLIFDGGIDSLFVEKGIDISNLSFQYEGPYSAYAIKELTKFIPEGRTTAIVGASGSGKTTLMKMLLKFYEPTSGSIHINGIDINNLSPNDWRSNCGVVMQEGFMFSDTIERNIASGDDIDPKKIKKAITLANLDEFIDSLPLGLKTKIGASGNGISGGQKQRILIARAIYKNPKYIFLDEATSALDAENEKIIHDNLQNFFLGKTVVIIAHRLSTVKNAHNIVVLEKGKIVENGNHKELVELGSKYFNLVKNQLELGN
jgi:ATP-binding cassette subfamily B protein